MDERYEVDTQTHPFRHNQLMNMNQNVAYGSIFFLFYFLVVGGFLWVFFSVLFEQSVAFPEEFSCDVTFVRIILFCFCPFLLCFSFPFSMLFSTFRESPKTDFNVLFIFVSSPNFVFFGCCACHLYDGGWTVRPTRKIPSIYKLIVYLFIGRVIPIGPHIFRGSIEISASGHGGIFYFSKAPFQMTWMLRIFDFLLKETNELNKTGT